MNYKKLVIQSLVIIAIILVTIASFVIYIDPYQQYSYKDGYISNQRLENPGIAKWHDYNAIITGSSMSMNHYPTQIDSLFGWNTINLSVMGSTGYDYEHLIPFVIKQGKVENVIMELDFFSFIRHTIKLDLYLYDNNIWNDYEYWFNYTSIENCIKKLSSKLTISKDKLYHFNSPCGKEIVTKKYNEATWKYFREEQYNFEKMKECFDKTTLPVFSLNRNVGYYIYFPPYSIFEFKLLEKYGFLDDVLNFKKYTCERLLELPNIKLYDFQCDSSYICDLDEYMDIRHHSHKFNKRIIKDIYLDTHRVTKGNYLEMINELERLTIGYKVE